jgi:Peptidase S24-like
MSRGVDRVFSFDGRLYIPCNTVRLSAGPFVAASPNSVDQHVELPPEFLLYRHLEVRLDRAGPTAAWVQGNSMMDRDILDGDLVIFQRYDFDYLQNGKIVVVERIGEEEGFGAWALKKLLIRRPRSSYQSEYGDEIDWNDPEIVLSSYNPRVSPSRLDPSGQYRVHGIFLRSMRRYDVTLVESEVIRRLATGEE